MPENGMHIPWMHGRLKNELTFFHYFIRNINNLYLKSELVLEKTANSFMTRDLQ